MHSIQPICSCGCFNSSTSIILIGHIFSYTNNNLLNFDVVARIQSIPLMLLNRFSQHQVPVSDSHHAFQTPLSPTSMIPQQPSTDFNFTFSKIFPLLKSSPLLSFPFFGNTTQLATLSLYDSPICSFLFFRSYLYPNVFPSSFRLYAHRFVSSFNIKYVFQTTFFLYALKGSIPNIYHHFSELNNKRKIAFIFPSFACISSQR